MSKEKIIFRRVEESELKIIQENILGNFGEKALQEINHQHIWIREGKIKEVFTLHNQANKLAILLEENLYSAGTPIGSIWNEEFQLEIEGAFLISSLTEKKLTVKTDQFLYGKPIFKENIEQLKEPFNANDLVIVLGKNSLHYGIGKTEIDSNKIEDSAPNTIVIKGYPNKPLDRGWYLRKGK